LSTRDSIPASATAELAPARVGPVHDDGRRRVLARLVRTPLGAASVALTTVLCLVGLLAPALAPHDPFAIVGPSLDPPSLDHPMGTDGLGRDLFSGVVLGTRTSLTVAGGVGMLVLAIGGAVGLLAGYRGGWTDHVLMRLAELLQVLPRFFLAIVVIALFGPGLDRLVLVLGLTSWPILARVVRSEVLSLKEREFVDAARAGGAGPARIVMREILPNALPTAVVYVGLLLAQVLLVEASLGFLGLGDPNVASWGYLAGQAQRFLRVAWWLSVFPGLAIATAVVALNLLGDALTDALGRPGGGGGRGR